MSDLTITERGVTVVKNTGGEFLSADKKLNQMKMDVISLNMTTDVETHADNDAITQAIEIPNAVSVKGGSAIIQSIVVFNLDNSVESPAMEVVFATDNTNIASDEGEAVNVDDTEIQDFLGTVTVSNWSTMNATPLNEMATKSNIGLVVKAGSTTRSLFCYLINRSGGNYTPSGTGVIKMKVGIVQD
tara:strand:- start:5643 stop:6203 length:561 start_codon:yes stop_codon:yes gene_type:complete